MNLSLVPYISPPAPETLATVGGTTYRECLKNHAAAMGGQAFDGCGEFMPVDSDPLKCAACGCHRNFHRREISDPDPVSFFSPPQYYPNPERGGSDTPPRRREMRMKRYRTKFTAEQKEKMRIFAEKLGWRIQKHDGADLEKFCVQIGVNRHVLKIWMHNHKNNPATTIRV